MEAIKLYSVKDDYINYLREVHKRVYSNADPSYHYKRKYLGAILYINSMKYFIPLSSPKDNDYQQDDQKNFILDEKGDRIIRKSTMTIVRIVDLNQEYAELKGTLRISNMIPVPVSELVEYDLDDEPDTKYKDLINKEMIFIRKEKPVILKQANIVYNQKNKNENYGYIKNTLDFKDLERMTEEWIGIIKKIL